ncbi:cytidine deaminase [Flavobacterium croceum DSM 17960]|uniref:Cytidine deaminase n=1 Tax=Flavobacterium croceum DSM 17960 TaxID=1121886 RepID=A0A2S4N7U7_9FLAO|nr:cytidine deaminase [Flavobacterium croceum]POS01776.1 cytidine deaminase [Flavobacterium croceum DSM 17960]
MTKQVSISTKFDVFENLNVLPNDVQELMQKAIETRNNAYAPYSRFHVGAAILLDNNQIVLGSNQENAAYPSGLCAERVAIFQAGALYPNAKIVKMAITAASSIHTTTSPIPPCGACRQSMAEYEFKQEAEIEIYFMGETGEVYKSDSVSNLLPLSFDKKFL